MTECRVSIINKSGIARNYLLLVEKPVLDPSNAPQIFTNICFWSPRVESGNGSTVVFVVPKEWFAVCGTSLDPLATGSHVRIHSHKSIEIARTGPPPTPGDKVYMSTKEGAALWLDKKRETNNAEAGFVISTDTSFRYDNEEHFFAGLGVKDPNQFGSAVPAAAFHVEPGREYFITPKPIYYICSGTYTQGEVVDITQLGNKLQIDLSKGNITHASYTHNDYGNYIPDNVNSSTIGKNIP